MELKTNINSQNFEISKLAAPFLHMSAKPARSAKPHVTTWHRQSKTKWEASAQNLAI